MKPQMPHLSTLSSPKNLSKGGVSIEDSVLGSTWQVAGQPEQAVGYVSLEKLSVNL